MLKNIQSCFVFNSAKKVSTFEYEDKVLKAQLLGELCDEDSSLLENLYYKEVLMLIRMTLSSCLIAVDGFLR